LAAEFTTRSLAGDVERATTRIHDLVMSVKRFTFMDRAATAEPTNIAQGLADTVAVLASKARAKSAAIRLDIAPNLPSVSASAGELNQVWANLIENALDAIPEAGTVWVSARPEGKELVVRVIDDGSGIPPDIQGRIFDPFFTTKPIGQGTGLGLDISLRIVRNFGGQIALESLPGRTEFRVALPIDSSQ
jgi:signal transduction histidine kinase